MVDHQVDGVQRVDLLRIAAELDHRVAHRGKVDHGGNAGEILQQDARRAIGDFKIGFLGVDPFRRLFDIGDRDRAPVFVAQQVLEENLEGERQTRDIAVSGIGHRAQAVIIV